MGVDVADIDLAAMVQHNVKIDYFRLTIDYLRSTSGVSIIIKELSQNDGVKRLPQIVNFQLSLVNLGYLPNSAAAFFSMKTLYGGTLGGNPQPGIRIYPRGAFVPLVRASRHRV